MNNVYNSNRIDKLKPALSWNRILIPTPNQNQLFFFAALIFCTLFFS